MITFSPNQTITAKVYLNQELLNENEAVSLSLSSPSRPSLEFSKTLTRISAGFYSFEISVADAKSLKDDTYSYTIVQNNVILKYGKVRLEAIAEADNLVFDYTLDFTL